MSAFPSSNPTKPLEGNPLLSTYRTVYRIITRYAFREMIRTAWYEPRLVLAYRRRSLTVPCLPSRMMIDPITLCNLRCPLCPTGQHISGMTRTRMEFDLFAHILSLNPRLKLLDLFNLGEPFMNPDLFQMLDFCRNKGIRVAVHTNLVILATEDIDRLLESPPARLHLSIDGMTPATYGLYRVGGDFERLQKNLVYLSQRIRKTGKGPSVEWVFLYHRGNRHEIPLARALAKRLGFTFYARPLVVPSHLASQWHDPTTLATEAVTFKADVVCPHLWLQMTVKPTGALTTCCFAYHDLDDVVSLKAIGSPEELLAAWNGPTFRRARACFRPEASFRAIKNPILCETCNIYPRRGGLDPTLYPYDSTFRDWM